METTILCIIGASGSGKTTVEESLCRYRPGMYHRIVSHTTRPMRKGETDGEQHIFVSPDRVPEQNLMLAYTKYGDYEYWAEEEDIHFGCINTYVIDVDGYHYLKKHFGDRYAVRVLYVRRRDIDVDADRMERDRGRLTLLAEEVDWLYNNDGSLLNIDLDMPRLDREISEEHRRES